MCASRFIEWDQKKDSAPGAPPVAMMVSSTRVRSVFGAEHFKKIVPPVLDVGVRTRSRGAGVAVPRASEDLQPTRYGHWRFPSNAGDWVARSGHHHRIACGRYDTLVT